MGAKKYPLEAAEQLALAKWLDKTGVLWCHVPNGVHCSVRERTKLKRHGMKRGVPDVLIFGTPPIAIELKRRCGGSVSPDQLRWLKALQSVGWIVYVCEGADVAIETLREHGYEEI